VVSHAVQPRAQQVEALAALARAFASHAVGARGRVITAAGERVDASATWLILNDLRRRGFGPAWVAGELGYRSGLQVGRRRVTRRLAGQIEALAARVGSLSCRAGARRPPTVSELIAAATPHGAGRPSRAWRERGNARATACGRG
jgi:hypothetical protein